MQEDPSTPIPGNSATGHLAGLRPPGWTTTTESLGSVVLAFGRETVRQPVFWSIVIAYVALILWWCVAVPWQHHLGAADRAPLPSTWPLSCAWVWLLRHAVVESRPSYGMLDLGAWLWLRSAVTTLLMLAIVTLLHVMVAGTLRFHVEPTILAENFVVAIAGTAALAATSQPRSLQFRLVSWFIVCGLLTFFRQRAGAYVELVVASILISTGCLLMFGRGTHALRDPR